MRLSKSAGPVLGFLAALAFGACSRQALQPSGGDAGREGGATDVAGTTMSTTGAKSDATSATPDAGTGPIAGLDPGRVSIHRLNNLEYDNTMRDLVGFVGFSGDAGKLAQTTFISDEKDDFDNNADALTIGDARYEQYFNAADAIAEAVFAAPSLRARIMLCGPATPADRDCTARIVGAFGERALRRPLTVAEVARFVAFVTAQISAGKDFDGAIKTFVKAMLASVEFLYRIEYDADPASLVPHAVAPYELASRLSYWLWSTMPDDDLFARAADGTLSQPVVLVAQVDRLLADPRSRTFVESFAGQWLGVRDLATHQVEPTAFPAFDEPLRAAMSQEMYLYFDEFLRGDRPFDEFLDADVNFVNARLARHYGFDTTGLGEAPLRVENTHDARKGFVGLAGWLTLAAYSYRTSPLFRGLWLLRNVLCGELPPFPPGFDESLPPGPDRTLRQAVDEIDATPKCAACHGLTDPMGIALEEFDAVGAFRASYGDGTPIDTHATLPDGTKVANELDFAEAVARDPRFLDCASEKVMTYALGRSLAASDQPYLTNLRAAWSGQGHKLRALLELIVVNDIFRFRRGETNP